MFLQTRLLLFEGDFPLTLSWTANWHFCRQVVCRLEVFFGDWTIRIPSGWIFVIVRGLGINKRNFLVLWFFGRRGYPSISIFRQKLDPPLVESQRMAEVTNMCHPINCSREHVVVTCNPNGRNGIPELPSSVQKRPESPSLTRHPRNGLLRPHMRMFP